MMKEAQQQVERAVAVDGLRVEPRRQRNALVHDAAAQLCSSICFLRGGAPVPRVLRTGEGTGNEEGGNEGTVGPPLWYMYNCTVAME